MTTHTDNSAEQAAAPSSAAGPAAPNDEGLTPLARMARGTSHWRSALGDRWRADLGSIPVIVGLLVIWVVFQSLNSNYLSSRNLSNLVLQMGVVGILALGVVLVLLLGEIDLSLGATAGVTAALLGVALIEHHWPVWASIVLAVVAGAAIGLLQGGIVVAVGVPSFIVTLGGLMAWQGVQLGLLGDVGELRITDPTLLHIANSYLSVGWSWLLFGLAAGGYGLLVASRRRARTRAGLRPNPLGSALIQVVGAAGVGAVLVAALNAYFGVPVLLVVLYGLTVGLTWLTRRTAFGRHMYAVGGNAEAARRAGIPVARTRLVVFGLTSALAGVAGVVSASRQFSVSTGTGGGTLLLDAIAAAVIGGASLFGGRGRPYQALLGALVITSVANGLDLLGQPSSVKNVATGGILVLAVCLDAVSRRRRISSPA